MKKPDQINLLKQIIGLNLKLNSQRCSKAYSHLINMTNQSLY